MARDGLAEIIALELFEMGKRDEGGTKKEEDFAYLESLKASSADQRSAVTSLSGYFNGVADVHPNKTYTAAEVAKLLDGLFEIGQEDIRRAHTSEAAKEANPGAEKDHPQCRL